MSLASCAGLRKSSLVRGTIVLGCDRDVSMQYGSREAYLTSSAAMSSSSTPLSFILRPGTCVARTCVVLLQRREDIAKSRRGRLDDTASIVRILIRDDDVADSTSRPGVARCPPFRRDRFPPARGSGTRPGHTLPQVVTIVCWSSPRPNP